ncbi:MAG: acyl-CoA synthetase [Planctomycetaceae bacterium]|nr:acyl-CoA synthetase [Planctomycetaceae bacterium]
MNLPPSNPYAVGLEQNPANFEALSPLSFLPRAARTYPNRIAWIHGDRRVNYAEFYRRCRRLASALTAHGVRPGDTVSIMAANIPAMLEAHYGVPMTGAVLNTLNVRLDAATIGFMLEHAETKVLLTDREFAPTVAAALAKVAKKPLVIDLDDPVYTGPGDLLGEMEYEAFLETGDPEFEWRRPTDEWDAISLNYTSGTTGNPKGVVFHHRGAYLLAIGNILAWNMANGPIYLWTLPMFHCNGWCLPWTMSAVCGTHVCLRRVEATKIFELIDAHGVTHLCGAPIVLSTLINGAQQQNRRFERRLEIMTAASAPPSSTIAAMEALNCHVSHVYGLTETYGPATMCAWHDEWDDLPLNERAVLKARQGVPYAVLEGLMVADPETLEPVPADGQTLGEVFLRGNIVMKGYLKNIKATEESFRGGWFHSGDLAVMHPNNYIELKDRSKDIIISGGENISSLEVEEVLYRHPAVADAACVARPDERWGETPCVFIDLRSGHEHVTPDELITHCRQHLAGFKVPKTVVFGPLPRTSTGKIQKFVLRDRASKL